MDTARKPQKDKGTRWGLWYVLVIGVLVLIIAGLRLLTNHFS